MYGVLFGRPYILRDGFFIWPWTFFLYILSAVGSGPMFTVLVCTFMEKLTGRKLVSWDVKQLMGKIAGTMFTIYMVFKLVDTAGWVMDILPRSGMTFDQMFHGWTTASGSSSPNSWSAASCPHTSSSRRSAAPTRRCSTLAASSPASA